MEYARAEGRAILTQDLDLATIVALSGAIHPSVVFLRLSSSRIEAVNAALEESLPGSEVDVINGIAATIEDGSVRRRALPVS